MATGIMYGRHFGVDGNFLIYEELIKEALAFEMSRVNILPQLLRADRINGQPLLSDYFWSFFGES
jgi:hypothetical protein